MVEEERVQKSEEEIQEATEKVLYPETHTKNITFLGKPIELRPLPISVSKKLNTTFTSIRKKMASLSGKAQGALRSVDGIQQIDEVKFASLLGEDDINMDMEMAESILESVFVLCQFYKLGFEKIYIDDNSSLEEASAFIDAQLAIQGENDFLLSPLLTIMSIMKGSVNTTKVMNALQTLNRPNL